MKKVYIIFRIIAIASLLYLGSSQGGMAQQTANENAKEIRREARKLTKAGWVATPGALSITEQLNKSYQMLHEFDEEMLPKYIMGEAISVGENYDAAKMQALELSKQYLAAQIQTEMTMLIENMVSNRQMESEQATSITESVLSGKNLITQSFGRILPVMEI
jgi:hypothetical protein